MMMGQKSKVFVVTITRMCTGIFDLSPFVSILKVVTLRFYLLTSYMFYEGSGNTQY